MDSLDTKTIAVSSVRPPTALDSVSCLVVVEGEQPGLCVEIPASMTIGRDTSCRLRFKDPGLSKFHCRVRREGERVLVSDLGSTNGTYLDGRRIEGAAELRPDAVLQLGSQVLRHESRPRAEIARARELAGDLEKARAYVAALIPAPRASGELRTDWRYLPSAVLGGDLLGYHALDGRRHAIYLLDVCGHGAGAAMHSASVFNVLKNQTLPATDFGRPEEVLAHLNASFQMERHGGMYLTLWYGVYDAGDGALAYASAGHPPALLKRASGELCRLQTRNPPIGVLEERAFDAARTAVHAGDRLYVFSDGAFEVVAHDGRQWAFEDFEALVREPERPGVAESERLRAAVQSASRHEAFEDDFSLLVVSLG